MGRKWNVEESDRLIQLCARHQRNLSHMVDWDIVMPLMPERTKAQCQTFVNNYLRRRSEEVKELHRYNYHWQPEDNDKLTRAVEIMGEDWAAIKLQSFPTISMQRLRVKYLEYQEDVRVHSHDTRVRKFNSDDNDIVNRMLRELKKSEE